MENNNNILVIAGMHRSMTSLLGQWLHACGLQVGDHLYGADTGNVKGHFEDKDFIQLHEYILDLNERSWRTTTDKEFQFDEYSIEKSKMLIRLKNKIHTQWGWKDPRTCLFLDHWNELLPNAKFIFIYRSYPEVVDSIIRRRYKVEKKREYITDFYKHATKWFRLNKIRKRHIEIWIKYNSGILEFIKGAEKGRYLAINNEDLLNNSKSIFQHLNDQWDFNINYTPIEEIYDKRITKKSGFSFLDDIDEDLLAKADQVERLLKKSALDLS